MKRWIGCVLVGGLLCGCPSPYGPSEEWPERFFECEPDLGVSDLRGAHTPGGVIEFLVTGSEYTLSVTSHADEVEVSGGIELIELGRSTFGPNCESCVLVENQSTDTLFGATGGRVTMIPGIGVGDQMSLVTSNLTLVELSSDSRRPVAGGAQACLAGGRWDSTAQGSLAPTGSGGVCTEPDASLGSGLGQLWAGSTCDQQDDFDRSCGVEDAPTEDVAFAWTAPRSGIFVFATHGSDFDTTLSLRRLCGSGGGEMACSDDIDDVTTSALVLDLAAGAEVVVVIDAFDSPTCGNAVLTVQER